jgi:hypothetical protein
MSTHRISAAASKGTFRIQSGWTKLCSSFKTVPMFGQWVWGCCGLEFVIVSVSVRVCKCVCLCVCVGVGDCMCMCMCVQVWMCGMCGRMVVDDDGVSPHHHRRLPSKLSCHFEAIHTHRHSSVTNALPSSARLKQFEPRCRLWQHCQQPCRQEL